MAAVRRWLWVNGSAAERVGTLGRGVVVVAAEGGKEAPAAVELQRLPEEKEREGVRARGWREGRRVWAWQLWGVAAAAGAKGAPVDVGVRVGYRGSRRGDGSERGRSEQKRAPMVVVFEATGW